MKKPDHLRSFKSYEKGFPKVMARTGSGKDKKVSHKKRRRGKQQGKVSIETLRSQDKMNLMGKLTCSCAFQCAQESRNNPKTLPVKKKPSRSTKSSDELRQVQRCKGELPDPVSRQGTK